MTLGKGFLLTRQRHMPARIAAPRRPSPRRGKRTLPALKGVFAAVVCFGMTGVAAAQEPAVTPGVVPPVDLYSSVAYVGIDSRDRSFYGYGGLIHALNGNINSSGALLRGTIVYGEYDYTLPIPGGPDIDGEAISFDALAGYQHFFPILVARVYGGVEYEKHTLTPDVQLDPNRGGEFGIKLRAELETHYTSPFHGSLLGSYGSAKEWYWVRGRVGYNLGGIILGPEAVFNRNPVTEDRRFGAYAILRNPTLVPFEISFSVGHSSTESIRGGSSIYGGMEVAFAF